MVFPTFSLKINKIKLLKENLDIKKEKKMLTDVEKRVNMNDVILTSEVKNATQKKVNKKKKLGKIKIPKNKVTAPLFKLAKIIRMKTKVCYLIVV